MVCYGIEVGITFNLESCTAGLPVMPLKADLVAISRQTKLGAQGQSM